jgi:Ca2+-binding EF-hand superfamily protein
MNRFGFATLSAMALSLTPLARAQDSAPAPAPAPTAATARAIHPPNLPDLIRQYDKNGDGILDDAERQAAREGLQKQFRQRLAARTNTTPTRLPEGLRRWDKNGDGKIDDQERAAARDELLKEHVAASTNHPAGIQRPVLDRAALLKEFDKDGDGKLSDAEREAAVKAFRERYRNPQAGPARESLLKRFDTNGDGVLDEAERKAAQESIARRNAEGRYRPEPPADSGGPAKRETPPAKQQD